MFPHPYSIENAHFYIQMDYSPNMRWAIHYQDEFVGMIGLHKMDDVYSRSYEVGYWLGEAHWGKGIATKALTAICQFAFELSNVNRVFAGVFAYNPGSAKVLEKVGFKKEGHFRQSVYKDGQYLDELRYGLLKSDFVIT